jgi:CheY-like chemotaxis protein
MHSQRPRVLIADDCADLRNVLFVIASEMSGAEVSLATDGVECLQLLDAEPYDLMFVDLQMPFIGGQTILEFFANGQLRRPGRVVVLSADLPSGLELASLAELTDAIIRKPFSVDDIMAEIDHAEVAAPVCCP